MKRIFALFLVLTLSLQPYSAQASRRNKASTKKLSNYILPYNRIVKMSPQDQVKYFMLLHSLVSQIEMRQIFHYTTKKGKASALLDFLKQNIDASAYANSAGAATPLPIIVLPNNPLPARSLNSFNQFGVNTFGLTRDSWDSLSGPFAATQFPQGALLTPAAIDRTVADAKPKIPTTAPASTPKPSTTPLLGAPEPEAQQPSGDKAEAKLARVETAIYKKEGAGCIYAGHFSKYRIYGDKLFCEQKGFNDPKCGGTRENPKVSCYTFNLKKKDGSEFLACTDATPSTSLTLRCNKEFIEAFQKSLPTQIDAEAYEKWRAQISAEVDNLTRADDENGFYNYCLNDNQKNSGLQKDECSSVKKTTEELNQIINQYGVTANSSAAPAKPPATGSGKQ